MKKGWEVVYRGTGPGFVVRRCYTRAGAWLFRLGLSDRFSVRRIEP